MLSRVLVPLDDSPTTVQIIPTLRQMLGGTGALVHLLAVRPPVRKPVRLPDRLIYLDELVQQEQAVWQDYLARQGSQLAYDGIVVHRMVRFGDPLTEILAVSDRHGMHLIALVAERQAGIECLLRPGLSQQLLARSRVPVLVVPSICPPAPGFVPRYSGVPV
jgi:nucleotide-binding universal stress UspA family protein